MGERTLRRLFEKDGPQPTGRWYWQQSIQLQWYPSNHWTNLCQEQWKCRLSCLQGDTKERTPHSHPQVSNIFHTLIVYVLITQSVPVSSFCPDSTDARSKQFCIRSILKVLKAEGVGSLLEKGSVSQGPDHIWSANGHDKLPKVGYQNLWLYRCLVTSHSWPICPCHQS